MDELEKCKKNIEKCNKLIKSGKSSTGFANTFCDVVGDSVALFMSPVALFMIAADCSESAKKADSKLKKSLCYTGAAMSGVLGAVAVAPATLLVGSAYLSVASIETARDFRNKKRLNKLINKKQELEEELKEIEMRVN